MKTKDKNKELEGIYSGTAFGDPSLIACAPEAGNGELEFFNMGRSVSDAGLEKEYEARGLVPAHPLALAAWDEANEDDPRKYFGTHWKDARGKWCYAAFDRWFGGRGLHVDRDESDWSDDWWFCGIKKPAFNKPKPALPEGESESIKQRLLPQIDQGDGCWNWNGAVSKGYGLIKVHSRSVRVHRLMYEVFVGPIPEGLVIDHLCRNKKCVNPSHLEAVTLKENTLRGDGPTGRKAKKRLLTEEL